MYTSCKQQWKCRESLESTLGLNSESKVLWHDDALAGLAGMLHSFTAP